jgi:hypothetical protein
MKKLIQMKLNVNIGLVAISIHDVIVSGTVLKEKMKRTVHNRSVLHALLLACLHTITP